MSSPQTLDARASVAWLQRFARTTPGVIGTVAVTVGALCVIAGLVCGAQLDRRIGERNAVLDRSEPFAYAAQNLYAALSAADAAAASEYLSRNETTQVRARYQQALADSAAALTDVTAGATDPDTRKSVADITARLAAYTGMVESARVNNRHGFVVGAGYLREASWLMQNTILPSAEGIYSADVKTLDADQGAIGRAPVVGFVLLGLVLLAIGFSSVIVCARTNRQLNLGLAIAAVAVALVGGWMLLATSSAASAIDDSRGETTAFGQLADARTLARQARTDEILELIARGDIAADEESFNSHIHDLLARLGTGPSAAAEAVKGWLASHRKQVEAYQNGDYNAAVAQAIGPDPHASAAQFATLESSLRDDIEQTRATLRAQVSAAGAWLAWSPTGTLVLMTLAGAAAVVGLWPRLKEFL
jgi:hypothetical protein